MTPILAFEPFQLTSCAGNTDFKTCQTHVRDTYDEVSAEARFERDVVAPARTYAERWGLAHETKNK